MTPIPGRNRFLPFLTALILSGCSTAYEEIPREPIGTFIGTSGEGEPTVFERR
jgi:hypothetical protein